MPRLIFKCPYIKGGGHSAASHLNNYVSYMATRPGVERVEEDRRPATKKQQEMVRQLLREFPLSQGMHEYQDYQASPTRANATEFISRALEENMDEAAKKENYLQYIAQRPNVQTVGSHGLFSGTSEPLVLSKVAEEVAKHPGSVWLPIISLRREDAARLGYDNVESWQALLSGNAMRIAEAMKIPWDQFRWYAAFHDQTHHPHVHMVCYSADGKSGYLTKEGIAQVKSMLAREIFRQDLTEVYQRQTQRRDELVQTSGKRMAELIRQMQTGTVDNERIGQLLAQLAKRLKHTSGKKQYGYLRPPLKVLVDEIVDELARDPRVSTAYDLWYDLREEVLRTYKDEMPPRLPLSCQKEFKQIKNQIIREAVRLGEISKQASPMPAEETESSSQEEPEETAQGPERSTRWEAVPDGQYDTEHKPFDAPLAHAVTNLLYSLGTIFQDRTPRVLIGARFTDRKLRQKIREKKIAMGHKPDDHENPTMA